MICGTIPWEKEMISGNTYYDVKHIRVSEGGRVWSGEEYGVERSREWRGVGRGVGRGEE